MEKFKNLLGRVTLIGPVVLFIIGFILFRWYSEVISTISIIIGIIFAIYGISGLINGGAKKSTGEKYQFDIASGVISLVIALVFILLREQIVNIFNFAIGGIILILGLNRLVNAISFQNKFRNYWIQILVPVLLILIGIYTVISGPNYVGLILMACAVIEIVGYVFFRLDSGSTNEVQVTEDVTLLVHEEETPVEEEKPTKKQKRIKKAKEDK